MRELSSERVLRSESKKKLFWTRLYQGLRSTKEDIEGFATGLTSPIRSCHRFLPVRRWKKCFEGEECLEDEEGLVELPEDLEEEETKLK